MYPNPAKQNVYVTLPSGITKARLKLYSILGKKVIDTEINSAQSKLNIEQFSKGIYVLKIEANSGSKTIKLIID